MGYSEWLNIATLKTNIVAYFTPMKWLGQKVHLIGITFFLIFDFIFYYPKVVTGLQLPVSLFVFICLIYALHIWFFNFLVVHLVHKIYPGLQNKIQKRIVVFLCLLPVIILLTSLFQTLFFNLLNKQVKASIFYIHYEDVGMNLLYSLIIIFFLELLYYFHHYTRAVKEAAELTKSNVVTQLQSLKNQVNPHFLFNSLNSLSSLIQKDPNQAVTFVHKLSEVYRYLLQTNEHNLTELEDELKFLTAYLHLLQTRFGNALSYSIDIEPANHTLLLPPLTLQMLIENAVKHNVVSANMPLHIEIYSRGGRLFVRNNLQKKKLPESNGVGLINIISKYKLITSEELEIVESLESFTVSLPLLNKDVYERINH